MPLPHGDKASGLQLILVCGLYTRTLGQNDVLSPAKWVRLLNRVRNVELKEQLKGKYEKTTYWIFPSQLIKALIEADFAFVVQSKNCP